MDAERGFVPTFTGKALDVINPNPDDICIEDIAHGLSNLCRWAGQIRTFYSVAEHSIWVSYFVDPLWAYEALMHDSAEAYLNDITRGVKNKLPKYKRIEENLLFHIAAKFLFFPEDFWPDLVKNADNEVGGNEIRDLVTNGPERFFPTFTPKRTISLTGDRMTPVEAERAFLWRFNQIKEMEAIRYAQ